MRAFLAVVPPREAREKIEAVREPLKALAERGRWVHPSLWHLTMKFLGEVEDELVPAIADLVAQVTARHESFELALGGFGMFPNADRPRVFWVGLQEGRDKLAELATEVDLELDGLGFEPDRDGFQPHMTLARFREPHEVGDLRGNYDTSEEICRFEVEAVVLMKSVLRPRGPEYSVVEKLELIPRERPEGESKPSDDAEDVDAATEEPDDAPEDWLQG